ncbi:MAG: Arm DNA-binding domain-containing protein [Neisseriaceae bacterium]
MDRTILKEKAIPEGLEIRNNTIRIHFMYKSIRCRETIKLSPTKTNIKYCANLRIEILNKIARNEFNYNQYFPNSKFGRKFGFIQEKKVTYCKVLLEQQLDNYTKMVANGNMSPSTLSGYRKIIIGQLIPGFGDYNIIDLTAPMIREWISKLNSTPKTIRNYLTPLRNMFGEAINNGIIKDNPIDQIALDNLIKIVGTRSDFDAEPFNEIEKQTIIDAAIGQIKNLIQFGFWSGLRTSELIALKWIDIDFKRKVANINRAKVCNVEKGTKTKSGIRILVLLPKALEALQNQQLYTKDSEYVFHNPNTNKEWANSNKVSDAWRKLLLTLNIRYRNCYQMRHTYASTLLSNGENAWWVATQMGHVDVEMIFKRYGRWLPKNEENGYKFVGQY